MYTTNLINKEQYELLDKAYMFFNRQLFQEKLPPCLITFNRGVRCYGYFRNNGFEARTAPQNTIIDEIALNPDTFNGQNDLSILSTLVG